MTYCNQEQKMNMPCYFQEGFTPQSGIDTITIWVHPVIINCPDQFHEQGNNNQPINLRFKREKALKTNSPIRTNYLVDIQAEAIDPNNDIRDQVLSILINLTHVGTLYCPQSGRHISDLKSFFYSNFDRLFALDRLDFYFDLMNDDMRLVGEANPDYPNTRYSSGNPSVLKAYFRTERLRQKQHISYEDIENMDYKARIEFSLRRANCDFLNICNLEGSYEYVFLRYLPFLARKWHDYRYQIVEVEERNLSYAHHLRKIITTAGHRIPHYNNNNLLQTPLKPIPYKTAKMNEVDNNFIAQFYGRS
jgi:hypothetical protein